MADTDEALGDLLGRLRKGKRLSQEELAALLGRHQSYVSRVEGGRRKLTVEDLLRWLDALGLTVIDVAPELDAIGRPGGVDA